MGKDKALLPFAGTTLLEHTISSLSTLATDIIVVAESTTKYSPSYGRVVADLYPGLGPVGGIITGLDVAGNGIHYVVACDMPEIYIDALQLMMAEITPSYDVVVAEIDGRSEPLCAVYSYTALPKLLHFLKHGGRAAHEALDALHTCRIPAERLKPIDPQLRSFVNINTPEDFEAWQASNQDH